MAGIDIKTHKKGLKIADKRKQGASREFILNHEINIFTYRLTDKQKESFYLELSTMLIAGMDLRSVLDLVVNEQKKERDRLTYQNIQHAVIRGTSFSEALRQCKHFTPYEYYSVQIGEETGKLHVVLKQLSEFYRYKTKQKKQLRSALSYPMMILFTSIGAIGFMLSFVIPMFSDIFKRFGGELPYLTKLIINLSNGLLDNIILIILLMVGIVCGFLILQRQDFYHRYASSFLIKLPVVGKLVRNAYLARFCSSMALLTGAKVPLLNAIALVRQMINFYPLVMPLEKVENEIMRGSSLSVGLSAYNIFDAKMLALIRVGEEVNQMDFFFERLASIYTEEVDQQTSTINTFLEPIMIVFLGTIIGFILVAMYLPMFQLSSSIG